MSFLTIRGKVIAPYSSDVVPLSAEIRADLERALAFAGEMARSCAAPTGRILGGWVNKEIVGPFKGPIGTVRL